MCKLYLNVSLNPKVQEIMPDDLIPLLEVANIRNYVLYCHRSLGNFGILCQIENNGLKLVYGCFIDYLIRSRIRPLV